MDGSIKTGRTVLEHCCIVAEIAKKLVAGLPEGIAKNLFPKGFELVAGVHDIGKISPSFQRKIFANTSDYKAELYPFLNIDPVLESQWGGHSGTGQICLDEIKPGNFIPEIVGQHHGFNPQTNLISAKGKVLGGDYWQKEREAFACEMKKQLNQDWPEIGTPEQARVIAGLTTVADWIGSGQYFEDPSVPWQDNISLSILHAGFSSPRFKNNLSFEQIFGFVPYAAQKELIAQTTESGVYILEAPMGQGKTEAALYAAYQLLCQKKARGIYFALPTQLTSNKIYERFNDFLNSILAEENQNRKAMLLHGSAWLVTGSEMGSEAQPGGSWFNSAKRGLLAPFSVGTIDQALMAAMNVKHGFVRAFGLAGKVVILDEVHTYDIYTGTILNALIRMLKNLSCTIIILSATLSSERKRKLMDSDLTDAGYPLITSAKNTTGVIETPVIYTTSCRVDLEYSSDDHIAMEAALKKADKGQQVLWIENSVEDAQKVYLSLGARAEEIGISCGLLHSRFQSVHRKQKEEYWVGQFGKSGWETRNDQGRILIGTQVLEQSLDIDADFLVCRFCPSDMIFQRIGRLWRHEKTPRHPFANREALLLIPQEQALKNGPKNAFGVSSYVYHPFVLHRSLEVWKDRRHIVLPQDIRPVIEATYQGRQETGFMAELYHELENGNQHRKGRIALEQLARITISREGKTLPETKAETRYSEVDTVDVLLLKSIDIFKDQGISRLTFLNGETVLLPWSRHRLSRKDWKKKAALLMGQMVKTGYGLAPEAIPMNWLEKIGLQHCLYLGSEKEDEALMRIALVDESGNLQGYQGAATHSTRRLQYRQDLGYCGFKLKE